LWSIAIFAVAAFLLLRDSASEDLKTEHLSDRLAIPVGRRSAKPLSACSALASAGANISAVSQSWRLDYIVSLA
jgi:hypothetical protein